MIVFISHSSANQNMAKRVEKALADHGIQSWLDSSDIRVGTLLRAELQDAIAGARVMVLLWSKPAARSRWVAAELLTAFHLNRFVIPCMLDASPPPFFLQNTLALHLRPRAKDWIDPLVRAVAKAPKSANRVPGVLSSQSQELREAIQEAADVQNEVLRLAGNREIEKALELQGHFDTFFSVVRKAWPLEPMILNLAGYNEKNRYTLKHWDAIQAGRPPKNRLLERAERYFFEALFANPNDYSALNGLGSVLVHSRDLDAAKFFIRRAIVLAKRAGVDYVEAKADLDLISRAR
jgi:tetratricopeptide (TPR) repeat protein